MRVFNARALTGGHDHPCVIFDSPPSVAAGYLCSFDSNKGLNRSSVYLALVYYLQTPKLKSDVLFLYHLADIKRNYSQINRFNWWSPDPEVKTNTEEIIQIYGRH